MTVLYGTLAISVIFGLFADRLAKPNDIAPYNKTPNIIFVILTALLLALVAGLRSSYVDTKVYMSSFALLPKPQNFFASALDCIKNSRDFGFEIFQTLIRCFTDNPQWLIFITSFIINVLFIMTLYKYAQPFTLAVFLYITNDIFTYSMNGIRQYMAAAIIFAGIGWLLDGKTKRFIVLILLAATFHRSALLFIPIYFIAKKKAWVKSTVIIMIAGVILFFALSFMLPSMGEFFDNNSLTNQYDFLTDSQLGTGLGNNFMRVIIAAVPVILAFIDRKKLHAIWPQSDAIINLSAMNVLFYLFGLYNALFSRLTYFTIPFQITLLCFIASKGFNKRTRIIINIIMILCYLFYFWYWMDYKMNFVYYSEPLGITIG
jgi:transmembrane protein EpsG